MTVQVHVLAAGFASKFESIGPYVGFGSLIAVAAMAVLVFAQGREIQRLREWTGRSPERLDELERTVAEQGVGAPVQGRQLQPHPGATAARPPARTAAGAVAAPGAAAAAAAAAAAPPGAPPRPPGAPGAAPAVAAGAPTAAGQATAVTGASTATGTVTPPPSNRPVPPRPTPPGGGPAGPRPGGGPRPATPLGAAGATARERGEGGPQRSVPQLVGVGVLLLVILVGVLFAAGVFGGGGSTDTNTVPQANERTVPGTDQPAYKPANVSVAVLNASGISKVAAAVTDRVDNNRFRTVSVNGSKQGGNLTRNGAAVTQTASIVGYRGGSSNRAAATAIAQDLRLPSSSVQPMSAEVKEAAGTGNPDIVVVLGSTWVNSAAGKRIVPDQGTDAAGAGSDATGTTSTGSSGATGTGSSGTTGTGGTSSGTTGTGGTSSGTTGTGGTAGTTDGTAGTTDGTGAATDGTASGGAGVTP